MTAASLSACGGDDAPTQFAPLHYDYLSRFQLNVGAVQVVDNAPPGTTPGDVSGRAPTPPDQALQQMAHDRLAAAGTAGTAIFSIDQASILHQPGGMLNGAMDVHLDIVRPDGQHAGFAEAKVTRDYKPDSSGGDTDSKAALYTLTQQMMNDMNVELELQIRRSLSGWLVDAGGTPVGGAIQQQTLGAPGSGVVAPVAATPGLDMPTVATPDIQTPTIETPTVATPDIASPDVTPMAASPAPTAAAPAPAPATTATSAAPSVPDAIFPTGGGDTDTTSGASPAASPAPTAKTLSPKPGYLSVPSHATTGTAPSTGTDGY
ncbi:hypothetical protein KGY14_14675 [Ameyamaea chiangmaiensis]|nr:hypothetical protein [Ameyamaea chiangmaiensis]